MRENNSGVFAVEVMGQEVYVGASTQVNIAFRDYMGWIKKNKAPKAIQAIADQMLAEGKELSEVIAEFDYEVVIECNDKARLKDLKKAYKQEGRAFNIEDNTVAVEVEPEVVEAEEVEMTVKERNSAILGLLEQGVKAKEIAEKFGVSKSTVYNVKNGRA